MMDLFFLTWNCFFNVSELATLDPIMLKKMQCDKGAIKFILSGANVMCPGLTSKGGIIDDSVEL